MKKLLLFTLLFMNQFSIYCGGNESYLDQVSEKIRADIGYLQKFFPCENNSENEKAVYGFIRERLNSLYIFYYEQSLDTIRGYHSFASNIIIDFTGKTENTLIIVVPVNNLEDNSFNISMALQLCEVFSKNTPGKNVKIIFTGSDFSNERLNQYLAFYKGNLEYSLPVNGGAQVKTQTGSAVFLQDFFPESEVSLLYINLSNLSGGIEIGSSTKSGQTPLWFLKQVATEMELQGIESFIDVRKNRLFKAGYNTDSQTDLFAGKNIPSVYLTSFDNSNALSPASKSGIGTGKSLEEKLTSFFLSLSSAPAPSETENNYITLPLDNSYFFISEKSFIIVYLCVITFFLLFAAWYSKNLSRYIRKMLKHFWIIPALFLLCFLFLLLATFTTEYIVSLKGDASLWIETPFTVFIIKILTALVLLFSSIFFLRKVRLPLSGSFYSSSAIFMMVINLLMFQFRSITLTYYAVWALVWIILFSFLHNRLLKAACVIISYYLIYDMVLYIFTFPALNLCRIMITDKISGNLLIAAVLMPMIMMILRVLLVQTHIDSARYRILRRSIYAITLFSVISLTLYYYRLDFFENKKQPVFTTNLIDADKRLSSITVTSPVKPGIIEASIKGNSIPIESKGLTHTVSMLDYVSMEPGITMETSFFLDRKNILIKILPEGKPVKVEVSFSAEENQIILDSNYPFTLNKNLDGGEFQIGYNPDFPLTLDILALRETSLWFTIKLIYSEPPFDMTLSGKNMLFSNSVIIKKSIYG